VKSGLSCRSLREESVGAGSVNDLPPLRWILILETMGSPSVASMSMSTSVTSAQRHERDPNTDDGSDSPGHTLCGVQEIVTYVEMTAPDQLIPAAPMPGLAPEAVDRGSLLIPGILARIGAAYGWRSASRTEQEWAAWFAKHPDRMF
jgi:hypothetical protein